MMDDATRVQMLATALCTITDRHHRTLENSRLHDPERTINFWHCECLTCKEVTRVLTECGIEPAVTTNSDVDPT
jgi:hypothetical protein